MKTYEDFDFFCPLSVDEALKRIAAQTAPGPLGSFYGTVNGNHFNLQHDLGREKDPSDDPQVTGYVVKERDGCRVFARAQVPEAQVFNANYGTMALVFFFLLMLKIWWEKRGNTFAMEPIELMRLPMVLFDIMIFVAMAYSGWRYMKTFNQKGKAETIRQFKQFMAPVFHNPKRGA